MTSFGGGGAGGGFTTQRGRARSVTRLECFCFLVSLNYNRAEQNVSQKRLSTVSGPGGGARELEQGPPSDQCPLDDSYNETVLGFNGEQINNLLRTDSGAIALTAVVIARTAFLPHFARL